MKHKTLFFVQCCILLACVIGAVTAYSEYVGVAYVDDANVHIEAPVHTYGSAIEGFAVTKQYTGDIVLAFGFAETDPLPKHGSISRASYTQKSLHCPTEYYSASNNIATCYMRENGTDIPLWSHAYESFDLPTKTIYWEEKTRIDDIRNNFYVYNIDYDGKNLWYVFPNIHISPEDYIYWKILYRVPLEETYKYDIALYPSSYGVTKQGILSAMQDNVFYLLDPFINTTNYEIGNVTNSSNTWDVDVNSTASTVAISGDGKTFTLGSTSGFINNDLIETWLDMSDGSGVMVTDETGNSSDALINGATWESGGISGSYLSFDGINDYLSFPVEPTYPNGAAGTVWAWVSVDAIGARHQIVLRSTLSSGILLYGIRIDDTGTLTLNTKAGAGDQLVTTSDVIVQDTGTPYLIGMTADGVNTVEIWVNGVEKTTTCTGTCVVEWFDLGDSYNIGRFFRQSTPDGSSYLNGSLYQVGFSNEVFGTDEWAELYNDGDGVLYDALGTYAANYNLYRSNYLPIAINVSSVSLDWNSDNDNNVQVNFTCDGITWSGNVSKGLQSCPTEGDVFLYEIQLIGNSTYSPVMQNFTVTFTEAENIPPVVTIPVFTPVAPNSSDDIQGSTIYTDENENSGAVTFTWYVNGDAVYNHTNTSIADNTTVYSTLNESFTTNLDVITLVVNASDGMNASTTKQASVMIIDTPATSTDSAVLASTLIDLFFYFIILGICVLTWWMYIKTQWTMYIAISTGLNLLLLVNLFTLTLFTSLQEYTVFLGVISIMLLGMHIITLFPGD